ncbi:MAG: pyridoxal phosphate-dependent aminotransferase [Actinobacteria bacterium]|nr:pyridoxal phosphate-dependent aminotransferase [Actinomycetota bacterium]
MEILEKAHELEREGAEVVHLEIGEPDFDTPEPVREAAFRALRQGMTRYTHSQGIPPLREAIADQYHERYGVTVSPDNIIVTSGTSPAMILVFGALLNPGEEIILSNPCYACYPNIVEFIGGTARYVDVFEEDGFNYRHDKVREQLGPAVKGVMINSPSNPTGIVLSAGEIEDLVRAVEGKAYIISDEIYHGLVYEGREHSILEYTDRCFVLNGFSKLYAMTGWRLGYVICPPGFVRAVQKIQQNILICANSFVQWAGIAAIKETALYVREMVETYNRRRIFLLGRLKAMGFGIEVDPTGAFYILANARRFTTDTYRFCLDVLEAARVAITPGIDFGSGGEGYVRFSYANSLANIGEGTERLERFLDEREE